MDRSIYKNKYISILGDSISTLDGYTEPIGMEFYSGDKKYEADVFSPDDTWWGMLIGRMGARLVVNNSISGSTVIKHPAYMIPSYASSDERTSALHRDEITPDVIIVYMGINDWGYGVPLSQYKSDTRENLSFFSTAYSAMLRKLNKNYPNTEIWCLTLPISRCSKNPDFTFPYTCGGKHIDEYCEVIRASAAECGCRVLDIASSPAYDSIDTVHPNKEGMKNIADAILFALAEL